MSLEIQRIHHISSITGPVQEAYNFYHGFLGLKLVKQTVNFDDASTYHLYFANQNVDNGTIMTLFPWDTNNRGLKGGGQGGCVAFAIPQGSLEAWKEHFESHQVDYEISHIFKEDSLHFFDSYQLEYALVETDQKADNGDIIGFYGMELLSEDPESTRQTLIEDIGMQELVDSEDYYRFVTLGQEKHQILVPKQELALGRDGVGTVHHIAWSIPNTEDIETLSDDLRARGYRPTDVKDRKYFKSVYMREKGRILFEYATDQPGFTVDEDFDDLGENIQLPEFYQGQAEEIIKDLTPLNLSDRG